MVFELQTKSEHEHKASDIVIDIAFFASSYVTRIETKSTLLPISTYSMLYCAAKIIHSGKIHTVLVIVAE